MRFVNKKVNFLSENEQISFAHFRIFRSTKISGWLRLEQAIGARAPQIEQAMGARVPQLLQAMGDRAPQLE